MKLIPVNENPQTCTKSVNKKNALWSIRCSIRYRLNNL